jgi:phage tail sheath protein FI
VYIEEVPSGVRPITGVATSIAAFIGFFSRGPINDATRILSAADFERAYGGLRADSLASYALQQFFLNGGQHAWVVRTASGAFEFASVEVQDVDGTPAFRISAATPGEWGNNLRVAVDYGTSDPATTFNLTVSEVVDGDVARTESFLNLTTIPGDRRYAVDVVGDESTLIRLEALADPPTRPAPTGTVSAPLTSLPADLTGDLVVSLGGAPAAAVTLNSTPTTMTTLRAALQEAIRRADPARFSRATVTVSGSLAGGAFLQVRSGNDDSNEVLQLSDALATALGFDAPTQENVQFYAPGNTTDAGKQENGVAGHNGDVPGAQELIDALPAFDPVDLINLLCIPDTDQLPDADAAQVAASATAYAASRRAFYILDPPQFDLVRNDIAEIEAWIDTHGTLRHQNAATYFPRTLLADPLNDFRLRAVPVSGTIAGLYARIDAERGVWKAPAGLEAVLRGVQQLEYVMSDAENGVLNPIAVNALRTFRAAGNVSWGARTLVGADQLASQWKYIPVRRLALFLEESLYRGTQFAVFEPNDEPLWSQIRLNVGAFMQSLFLQGAFQGQTPRQAYLVKCDSETTTQDDINRGIVNVLVGFAPLKPAEFVMIRIKQLAGQTQA